ncbi:putative methyltransferase-like protein 7A [Impatiens glandulifera]|uniref:putative methyltransferase-like protein 7A n=1 Tax=Impatiens glandulifera TaxID=253017 RepID=UPI001FB10A1B|nr:putative methyltransferase-like protein 7A [Impatiens glandulifera]
MILLHSPHPPRLRLISLCNPVGGLRSIHSRRTLYYGTKISLECNLRHRSISPPTSTELGICPQETNPQSLCSCGRRRFVGAIATAPFLPILPSYASASQLDPADMLNQIHPPRADWYEEFYASVMATEMKSYESEISGYKSQIFADLGRAKTVLEIGIGTGPNLKYYADSSNIIRVYGIDPNRKMKKYAQESATLAGLSSRKFDFIPAVAEALPLDSASVDVVIGTLVLCSVQNVHAALQEIMRVLKPGGKYLFVEHVAAEDGSILRFIQEILDPLQQVVADGCHLTRKTGKHISDAGFSNVKMNTTFLKNASLISPHIFGIAFK